MTTLLEISLVSYSSLDLFTYNKSLLCILQASNDTFKCVFIFIRNPFLCIKKPQRFIPAEDHVVVLKNCGLRFYNMG